jgi:hypothetical protein
MQRQVEDPVLITEPLSLFFLKNFEFVRFVFFSSVALRRSPCDRGDR